MDRNKTPIINGNERNERGQFVDGNTASKGHGRPKNTPTIPNLIKSIGAEKSTDSDTDRLTTVVNKLFELAENGNIRAIETIFNRLEGKTPIVPISIEREYDEIIEIC